MKTILLVGLVGCVGISLLVAPQARGSVTITFDEFGLQPQLFVNSNPLREQYAGQGVHFAGPTSLNGGAILDQGSSFGVPALSGQDFLAFNSLAIATMLNGGTPVGPETIQFDFSVSSVSIFAGDGQGVGFNLTAYDAFNNVVGVDNQVNSLGSYVQLAVAGSGITKITFDRTSGNTAWVVDNLTFQAVPEPGTVTLVGLGLAGLLAISRRKK
jgi:hypothetical protein